MLCDDPNVLYIRIASACIETYVSIVHTCCANRNSKHVTLELPTSTRARSGTKVLDELPQMKNVQGVL